MYMNAYIGRIKLKSYLKTRGTVWGEVGRSGA